MFSLEVLELLMDSDMLCHGTVGFCINFSLKKALRESVFKGFTLIFLIINVRDLN